MCFVALSASSRLTLAAEELGELQSPFADDTDGAAAAVSSCGCTFNCDRPQVWARAECLLWWTKGTYLPPLLTTGPDGASRETAGVLGQDGTEVIYGDSWTGNHLRTGARFRLGYEFSDFPGYGLEGEFLGLGSGANGEFVSPFSTGSPILARPVVDATTGQEDAQLIAYPDVAEGRLRASTSSDLYSAAALLRKHWLAGARSRWDLLGGYRYFRFRENLSVTENLTSLDPGGVIQVGTQIDVFDRFQTSNDFHGGELGVEGVFERGPWAVELLARVALGNVHQVVQINGETHVTTPGDPTAVRPGGLLALPSNIGTCSDNMFAVLPQLGANVQWKLGEHLSLTGGYTCLVLSSVVRAGEQVDRTIDPSQLSPLFGGGGQTPATRPQDPFFRTSFWAQGINLGVQVTY